ncbi:MAG: glycosyl transferase [Bellilinea sp.]|nr:MAG: glycosyl transferase [Bellilinea sp.]
MKVSFLHYSAPPVVGGVENVMASQAECLSNFGYDVEILCGRGQRWHPRIEVKSFPLLDSRDPQILEFKKFLDKGQIPSNFEEVVSQIYNWLVEVLADTRLLIAHNVASQHKNLALTAALYRLISSRQEKLAVILWHHDFAWTASQYKNELYPSYPWDLCKKDWKGVTHVAVSDARKQDLVQLTGIAEGKVKVIPAGINQKSLLGLTDELYQFVAQNHLLSAEPFILMPIRVTRRKNFEMALRITASLKRIFPMVKLVVTGPTGAHNPTNEQYLKELLELRRLLDLENQVFFLAEYFPDGISEEWIGSFYRMADVLLLTSKEEGFGIPILEAGLSRLLIFCSDIAPLRALTDGHAHLFSLHDSPEIVAEKIAEKLNNDLLYAFRAKVRKEFTWEAVYTLKIAPLISEIFQQNDG